MVWDAAQDAANGLTTGGASSDLSHAWGGARDGPRRGGRGRGLGSFRSKLEEDDDEDYFNQEDDDDGAEHGPPAPAPQAAAQDKSENEAPMGLAALGTHRRHAAPAPCCLFPALTSKPWRRSSSNAHVARAITGAYEDDEDAEGSPRKREDQDGEGDGASDAKRARRD
jgi:hypothetical protein